MDKNIQGEINSINSKIPKKFLLKENSISVTIIITNRTDANKTVEIIVIINEDEIGAPSRYLNNSLFKGLIINESKQIE